MPRKSSLQHAPSSFYSSTSSSVQEAQGLIQLDREDKEVYKNISGELEHLIEQVDGVFDRYSPQLEKFFEHKEPEARSQAFLLVAENLFRKGITTLRIFVLLRFAYKLVQHFFLSVKNKMEQHLGTEVTEFILLVGAFLFKAFLKCRILPWLKENGGWRILLPSFNWGGLVVCAGGLALCAGGVFLIRLGLQKMSSSL